MKRLQYQKRSAAGLCCYGGCPAKAESRHRQCKKHLRQVAMRARETFERRKAQGLCGYCGVRPQFWGTRCILCRQLFARSPLPVKAKRALRLYRREQRQKELQSLLDRAQKEVRAEVLKLLTSEQVRAKAAQALRLYVGLDDNKWRTYQEVAEIMHTTKQNVHRLLRPIKAVLSAKLSDDAPWAIGKSE